MDSVAPYHIYFKLSKTLCLGLLMGDLLMINYSANIDKQDKLSVIDYKKTAFSHAKHWMVQLSITLHIIGRHVLGKNRRCIFL